MFESYYVCPTWENKIRESKGFRLAILKSQRYMDSTRRVLWYQNTASQSWLPQELGVCVRLLPFSRLLCHLFLWVSISLQVAVQIKITLFETVHE